jgi:cell division protein FtsB
LSGKLLSPRALPMEEYGDFRIRRQHTVLHSLNRLLVALIAFTVITLIACAFVPELKNAREQDDRIDQLRDDIQKERDLLAQHTRQVDLLTNDPTYIETIARDRLDMMKDGETIYRIDPAPTPDQSHMRLTQ